MFSRFERLLKPTDPPEQAAPPPDFIAFFWHFARQAKGLFAALFAAGLVVALLDSTIPVFMGRIVTLITASPPDELFAQFWPHLARHGAGAADRAPARADGAEPDRQPGDLGQCVESHPLAEPLVRGAAVLGLLPERLRRPHRQPGDADRPGDPRDLGRAAHQRLVHPGLRHERARPARIRRPCAGAAGGAVVPRLPAAAARPRAAHARPLQGGVGRTLPADRAHRRQLHQHPHREAVCARARGGCLCARRHRQHTGLFYRSLRLNTLFGFCLSSLNAADGHRHGRDGAGAWTRGKVEVGTVAMALPLAWQIVNIAGWVALQVTVDLRECRRDPGGHDDHRPADCAD